MNNPFRPGNGIMPHYLAGKEDEIIYLLPAEPRGKDPDEATTSIWWS